jgi:hypothetical protein
MEPSLALDWRYIVASGLIMGLAGVVKLLLSEIVIKRVTVILLKRLVKSTKNELDNELVAAVEDALAAEKAP